MPTNIGLMGDKNKRTSTNSKNPKTNKSVESAKTLSRKEKERKLLDELGSEQPGTNKRKKIAIGATAGVLGVTAVLVPTVKYLVDNQKHIITMKVQGTHFETYKLEVKKGSLIKELKTYTITGYTFVGFYKDEACTIPYTASERVTKNSTVYCKYEPTTYAVTYLTGQEGYCINVETDKAQHGFEYIFTVNIFEDYNKSNYMVKVNGKTITADEYGVYTVPNVESDLHITVENVVKNKIETSLNLGDNTLFLIVDSDASLEDVLVENKELIKQQIIAETLKINPNTYTQEQLENLVIQDLLNVTTCGIYADDAYTQKIKINEAILNYGEGLTFYINYATLDKLVFSNNGVASKDISISGEVKIPNKYITLDTETHELKLKEINSISPKGFYSCVDLIKIEIPENVISFGSMAFYGCVGLTEIIIPSGVNSIGSEAFANCKNLLEVEIPEGVATINSRTFYNCQGLKSIKMPESITSIGDEVFASCTGLERVIIPNSVTNINYGVFQSCTSLIEAIIPENVTFIGDYAFSYCSSLEKIIIPNSVTHIGGHAFYSCTSLTSVTIGRGVIRIGSHAFYSCSNLTETKYLGDVDSWAQIETGTIYSRPNYYSKNLYINDQLVTTANITKTTKIYTGAFYNLLDLTNVTIGKSVTEIGGHAFVNCENLTSITIPSSVKKIGFNAFMDCTRLKEINFNANLISNAINSSICMFENVGKNVEECILNIGSNLVRIENYSFYHANGITQVNIPNSITSIGANAFYNCHRLSKTNYLGDVNDWVQIDFEGSYSNPIMYSKNLYINNELVTILNINSAIKINNSAFKYCDSLTSVTIEGTVTEIGEDAFYNCKGLTNVVIGDGVTNIGRYAFSGCSALTSVEFKNTTGWSCSTSATATSGTSINETALANQTTAVRYLTSSTSYSGYYWKRT